MRKIQSDTFDTERRFAIKKYVFEIGKQLTQSCISDVIMENDSECSTGIIFDLESIFVWTAAYHLSWTNLSNIGIYMNYKF